MVSEYVNVTHTHYKDTHQQSMTSANAVAIIGLLFDLWGILCNITVIKVMRRPNLSKLPRSVICIAWAVMNLFGLIMDLILLRIPFLAGISKFNEMSGASCKICDFMIYLCSQLDANMVVLVAIERKIAISRPLQARTILSRSRLRGVVIACTVFWIFWYSELFFRKDLVAKNGVNNETYYECTNSQFFENNAENYILFKDLASEVTISWIPIVALVPLNVATFIKFKRQMKMRSSLGVNERNIFTETMRMTIALVLASFAFIILLLPFSCYILFCIMNDTCFKPDVYDIYYEVFWMLASSVSWSINFVIYFVTGSLFRQELKQMLGCCTPHRHGKNCHDGGIVAELRRISTFSNISIQV